MMDAPRKFSSRHNVDLTGAQEDIMEKSKDAIQRPVERFVRRRCRGFRMPENTVYVGRPSKWGNPYQVKNGDRASAVRAFRSGLEWYLSGKGCSTEKTAQVKAGLEELRGKNLACWCPLTEPCHADVLLELAND
jgi:hypothetical protein